MVAELNWTDRGAVSERDIESLKHKYLRPVDDTFKPAHLNKHTHTHH